MPINSISIKGWLRVIVPGLLWVPYLLYVYHNSSGIPIGDDYDMFLGSLINFENASGLLNKLTVLFSQHMEHRPAFPRLVAWAIWKISGNCDFKVLILTGNIMLMLATLILGKANKKMSLLQAIFINACIILVVCGIQSKENIFWATGALQNYSLIAFATGAIFFSVNGKMAPATAFCLLAIGCSMSGFLIAPVIILIAFRNKKIIWSFIIATLITSVALLYFTQYHSPDLSKLPGVILQKAWIVKIKYFLAFLGSFASIRIISLDQALVAGVLIFVATLLLNRTPKKWDFWSFLTMFILLNALAGVNSRSELGSIQALSERYKILSELLFCCNLVRFFSLTFNYKTIIIAITLSLSIWVFVAQYQYHQSFVSYNKRNLKIGIALFIFHKNPMLLKYPIPIAAVERLMKSQEMKIYRIPLDD